MDGEAEMKRGRNDAVEKEILAEDGPSPSAALLLRYEAGCLAIGDECAEAARLLVQPTTPSVGRGHTLTSESQRCNTALPSRGVGRQPWLDEILTG